MVKVLFFIGTHLFGLTYSTGTTYQREEVTVELISDLSLNKKGLRALCFSLYNVHQNI